MSISKVKGFSRVAIMLLLSVCMTLLFVSAAFAVDATDEASLQAAFAAGGDVTLQADITTTAVLDVINGKTVNLDLNGHTLTLGKAMRAIGGTLNISGTGTITRDSETGNAINAQGVTGTPTSITIESGVTVKAQACVGVFPENYPNTNKAPGVTLNINGTLEARDFAISTNGTMTDKTDFPVINVGSTAKLSATAAAAVYAAGYAEWNFASGSTVTGPTAIYAKAGIINIDGATVTGNGAKTAPTTVGGGMDPTGSAIVLQTQDGYAGNIKLNITGGTITSANNAAVEEVADSSGNSSTTFAVSGGTLTSADGIDALVLSDAAVTANPGVITGGTFSTQPATTLLGSGLEYVTNSDGTTTVKAPTTPSTTPTDTASTTPTSTASTTDDSAEEEVMTTAVETGDPANIMLYLGIVLVAGAAMVAFVKKAQSVK